jgi:hypothetical protein
MSGDIAMTLNLGLPRRFDATSDYDEYHDVLGAIGSDDFKVAKRRADRLWRYGTKEEHRGTPREYYFNQWGDGAFDTPAAALNALEEHLESIVYDGMLDESGRAVYATRCPNQDETTPRYRVAEWKQKLALGSIEFACVTCETKWHSTDADRRTIMEAFAAREARYADLRIRR